MKYEEMRDFNELLAKEISYFCSGRVPAVEMVEDWYESFNDDLYHWISKNKSSDYNLSCIIMDTAFKNAKSRFTGDCRTFFV